MDIRERLAQVSRAPMMYEVDGIGQVFIRRMTLGEADELNAPVNGAQLSSTVRLLARFLGDEQGARIFDLHKPDDVSALRDIPVTVAAKLLELGNKVNAPPKEDAEKKA